MTKREVAELMTVLQANYPDSFRGQSDAVVSAKIALWHDFFKDYPNQVVYAAVKAFIATDTKGFMPNIGQINEQIQRMKPGNDMTPGEAWSIVAKAIRNSTYGAAEEFAKFPPEIQKAVGCHEQLREWALMDAETVGSVVASNFQKSFRIRQDRDRDMEKLPPDVREFIAQTASQFGMVEAPKSASGELGESEMEAIRRVLREE